MFIENDYARPLFDFEKGGPPKAFECLILVDYSNHKLHETLGRSGKHPCGKVTRTERGMRMHLKIVHDWKEQPCLYSTDKPTEHGSAESRKRLRAGPPRFPKSEPAEELTEKIPSNQKYPEMNEGELLKLMKEGN